MGKVDKQPAVVSGRCASVLGVHLCELLDVFWLRDIGSSFALRHSESEDQSLGLLIIKGAWWGGLPVFCLL